MTHELIPHHLAVVSGGIATATLAVAQGIPDLPEGWSSAPLHIILGLIAVAALLGMYHLSIRLTREHHQSIASIASKVEGLSSKTEDTGKAVAVATEALHALTRFLEGNPPCPLKRLDPRYQSDIARAIEGNRT